MSNIVRKSDITRETKIKILASELVKLPVVHALHSKCVNGFDFVAFGAQRGDKSSRQILIEENLHAG